MSHSANIDESEDAGYTILAVKGRKIRNEHQRTVLKEEASICPPRVSRSEFPTLQRKGKTMLHKIPGYNNAFRIWMVMVR